MSGPRTVADGEEAIFKCKRSDLEPKEEIVWQVTSFSGADIPFQTGRMPVAISEVFCPLLAIMLAGAAYFAFTRLFCFSPYYQLNYHPSLSISISFTRSLSSILTVNTNLNFRSQLLFNSSFCCQDAQTPEHKVFWPRLRN